MTDLAGIPLPDETFWTDEFDWTAIGQSVETDITGGLVIEYASGRSGRPVTLRAEWITRAVLSDIEALRDAAVQKVMTLTLPDTRTLDVLFRHHEGLPVQVDPVVERPEYVSAGPDSPDYFNVVIKLMEV
jgi:hypothetical protein